MVGCECLMQAISVDRGNRIVCQRDIGEEISHAADFGTHRERQWLADFSYAHQAYLCR